MPNLKEWIEHKRIEKLKLMHADLEAIVDMCTRIQQELKEMFDPPPCKPTDPKARIILNMGKIKEAMEP